MPKMENIQAIRTRIFNPRTVEKTKLSKSCKTPVKAQKKKRKKKKSIKQSKRKSPKKTTYQF